MGYLDRQFRYFRDNQAQLVEEYNGKILVISDRKVAGAFDSNYEAYVFGERQFGLGRFLLQKCIAGPAAYTIKATSSRIHP